MDEEKQDEAALFRFSLIAPLINGFVTGSIREYLEKICAKAHFIPGIGLRNFSPSTVRKWLSDYRRYGFDGLSRKARKDKGYSRRLNTNIEKAIKDIKNEHPNRTGTSIYLSLLNQGILGHPPVSLSTVQRYIKQLPLEEEDPVECKRFVFEFANDCWQGDTLIGPYIIIDGKKKRTYLIAIIDDASRIYVYGEFFFEENSSNLQTVLKKAILKRGIPKQIFCDNGKIYASLYLRKVCASLGITLSHARPYSPASKGKIERMFRTFRMQMLDFLDDPQSLDDLNKKLMDYAENTYNLRPHSSLEGMSPMDRYLQDKDELRFVHSIEKLEWIFLHEVTRKVNKDATISLFKRIYEAPQSLIGRSVTVRFDPEDTSKVYIKGDDGRLLATIYPVRSVENSRIVRRQNQKEQIDYHQLYSTSEDDSK
jgi:transposase InsO family protein